MFLILSCLSDLIRFTISLVELISHTGCLCDLSTHEEHKSILVFGILQAVSINTFALNKFCRGIDDT